MDGNKREIDLYKPWKLCYIEAGIAYFTTQDLSKQWGDDWNDAPYEHNAETPYEYNENFDTEREKTPWEVCKIPYYCEKTCLETPAQLDGMNSGFSVEDINDQKTPWLSSPSWESKKLNIWAGTSLIRFIQIMNDAGNVVFLPFSFEQNTRTLPPFTVLVEIPELIDPWCSDDQECPFFRSDYSVFADETYKCTASLSEPCGDDTDHIKPGPGCSRYHDADVTSRPVNPVKKPGEENDR